MPTSAALWQQPSSRLAVPAFLLLFFRCVAPQGSAPYFVVERNALLDLRSTLGLRSQDWPIKGDHCTNWTGIICRGGRVVGITVSGLRRTRLGRVSPQFAVDGLRNLTFLETFNASGFSLPGPVPDWLGIRVRSLRVLDLQSCGLTGFLPGSLGNLSLLNSLYLSDNNITGILSPDLGQLERLSILDIGRNHLTGSIPASFSSLSSLTRLDLSSNFLTGSIPPGFGNLSGLQHLSLSNNSLTGSVPDELGNLVQLVQLNLSRNSFSGALPEELFSSLLQLEVADLSRNSFTGNLPGLASGSNFSPRVLNFSNNLLYGNLNSSLGVFDVIDLSGNYFQGEPPDVIRRSNATLLARNCLRLPGQRSLADCKLFYSERSLVFYDSPEHAPRSREAQKFILVGVFGGLGFIVISVVVLILVLRKHRSGVSTQKGALETGPAPEGELQTPHDRPFVFLGSRDSYTYEQLVRATANFSDLNLIKHGHSGKLYRGILDSGTAVIIKRVDVTLFSRESFAVELEVLSKICHHRFVPLLGHCYNHEHEKLLVYKYMSNQDLATSFYRASISEDDSVRSLDWITRLKIAIGVAEGLSYLHNECNPPLVHRDVQAGSILLDDKFEVYLGSLSSACTQEGDPHRNVISRLLRKPQTSTQGLAGPSTSTCAHDVFCFGKVLLELVTGKLGLSNSEDSTTREWLDHTLPRISSGDKEFVMKIMDPSLILDEDLLDEVWAMAIIARSCLNPRPSKRPPIKQVRKALENPLRVIREELHSPPRLQPANSSKSWNFRVFGSWRNSSPENIAVGTGPSNSRFRQSGRTESQSSGGNDHSSSHKRSSNEIFPEPVTPAGVMTPGERANDLERGQAMDS
ncbi:hypothetical protein MLD38_012910 [Melastoma candidum]|uniref:Uncharacterized protein n=1 Tax=Melastoma candidum TaxID=119954 RepID=A0ACB9R7Y3_9MYRT|nr:hypothetical protein MLD38_012910 [Melastoma candidum]